MSAVQYRAMLDIQTAIVGAIESGSLPGLFAPNVVLQKVPTDRNQSLPMVSISPLPEAMAPEDGLNSADGIIYNILLALIAADNQSQLAGPNGITYQQVLSWRQNLRRLFNAITPAQLQFTPQTTEMMVMWVKPQAVAGIGAWQRRNLLLSMLLVQVKCRETRAQGS
jgi:hypothetical protein